MIVTPLNYFADASSGDIVTLTELASMSIAGNTMITPKDVYISDDGTKVLIQEIGSAYEIFRYDLSTAYDVTTSSFIGRTASLTTGDGIFFKPDGLKFYTLKVGTKTLNQATLSTAFDTSTKGSTTSHTYTNVTSSVYLYFNNDGTKCYKAGGTGVLEWTLSTAYDITTAGSETIRSSTDTIRYDSMAFYDSGNYVFLLDSLTDEINVVALSTAYDMSTMGGVEETHSVRANALIINVSGGYLYVSVSGLNVEKIYQYSLS